MIGAGGWTMKTPVDAATTEATSAVYYVAGQQQQAASIATAIGVKPAQVLPLTTATPVTRRHRRRRRGGHRLGPGFDHDHDHRVS